MPLYDYQCTQCGKITEVRHGFDESPSGACPACGSPLKRIFNPAPIVFKGSGFYVTDSRKSSAATSAPAKSESAAPVKTEATPAASGDAKSSSSPATESAA